MSSRLTLFVWHLGQNLAQVMLRVVVASIVRNFDIVAAAQTTEKTMEMKDSFVSLLFFPSRIFGTRWMGTL